MRIVHAYTDGDASTAEVKKLDMLLKDSEIIYKFLNLCWIYNDISYFLQETSGNIINKSYKFGDTNKILKKNGAFEFNK